MAKRAEQMATTRQRIVEAAVKLHGSVGPAATTITGIAEEAGVTRLTVYRHFPDDETLYAACSADWMARQRPPDSDSWLAAGDPTGRLRTGLADLYRFFREGGDMLERVYADMPHLPEQVRLGLEQAEEHHCRVLLDAFPGRRKSRRLVAAVGHAVSFWTWRSLCVTHELGEDHAVELMCALVLHAAGAGGRGQHDESTSSARLRGSKGASAT